MAANKNGKFINRTVAILVFFLGLISWAAAQETPVLVRADELTPEQRLQWREALEWPTHCRDGIYAWEDENHPVREFLDAGDDRYLVYNISGWNPYEINMFLVETDRPAVKPRLLTFKVLEPVYDPDPELGDVIKAPLEERIRFTLEQQEKVEYEARMISLIRGGIFVDEQGRLIVDKRSIMPGTCGTYSIYDLDYEPPQLVGFRAQFSCLGSNDVARWKSYSQEYIDGVDPVEQEAVRGWARITLMVPVP